MKELADVAQLAEQLICNQQVIGSSPIIGLYGWVPERPKGADCKSVVSDFGGSNPPPSILIIHHELFLILSAMKGALDVAGWSSLEARRAHNPKVVGSNPTPAISPR